jgi:hypothetical protein
MNRTENNHELTITTVERGSFREFRSTCSCGWGPRHSEGIEYLAAGWIEHERLWAKETIIELRSEVARLRDVS